MWIRLQCPRSKGGTYLLGGLASPRSPPWFRFGTFFALRLGNTGKLLVNSIEGSGPNRMDEVPTLGCFFGLPFFFGASSSSASAIQWVNISLLRLVSIYG
jgi:hypothetical protein